MTKSLGDERLPEEITFQDKNQINCFSAAVIGHQVRRRKS